MTPERLKELAVKWKAGTITSEEKREFLQWSAEFGYENFEVPPSVAGSEDELQQKLFDQIQSKINPVLPVQTRRLGWIPYAAAVIVILSVGGWLWFAQTNKSTSGSSNTLAQSKDLAPGFDRAILTLSNGQQVELSNATSETISDGTRQIKNTNGQLLYNDPARGSLPPAGGGGREARTAIYNTMTTPKGGQYQLILADGTKVWLNAASSITYPITFTEKTRTVSITGEAYFEVTPDKSKPFIVETELNKIQVLGTHFNINAYKDEQLMKTTLLEGSVKVSSKSSADNKILKPGQQALSGKTNMQVQTDVNTEEVMAWKNGYFQFEGANLESVMKQLSRWYNTEVIYEGAIPKKEFVGTISRKVNASKVLEMLEYAGVKFRIENKRIIVMSK